jgi:hypothetical protein
VSVPWKPATVRLDTYSGAPVEFAAYNVDPADVIIAGQSRRPRAIDTTHRKPLLRWKFSPPPGFRFESSDVTVPIGDQEGFYVVEARRGDAVQQVWINRTHVGLLTKESPEGLLLWGVDLRSGKPLGGMSVAFLVGLQLIERKTDPNGMIVWRDMRNRPTFALAEHNAARAFVSILPQAPLPGAIVGMRLESAAVRAGSSVRFAGFARRRVGDTYKLASGDVRVTLAGAGKTIAATSVRLDAAGAFEGSIEVPANAGAGDYAILAAAAGGVGGTSVHVDAAADLALDIRAACPCDAGKNVPLAFGASRAGTGVGGVPIEVEVVRTPHIVPPGAAEDSPRWGTTIVYQGSLQTGADGRAQLSLPAPTDGLDSTYGIRATTSGATATARVAVPSARIALAVEPGAPNADVGEPVAIDVRGFDPADGSPANGLAVRVRLSHGSTVQDQDLTLDERGRAHAVFRQTSLGSNMVLAEADVDGRRVLDAATILVEPSALSGTTASDAAVVTLALDKTRYRPGEKIVVRASAPGAVGDALVTLDGARTYTARLASATRGQAAATLDLGDPQGDVRVSAAFVRDGAIALGTAEVHLDGPGRARATEITLERTAYAPSEVAHVTVHDGGGHGPATLVIRVADGRESGPALFDDAPAVLSSGGTSSQNPASESPAWHAYVAPASSKASDIFAAEQPRKVSTEPPTLAVAAPRTMLWRVDRGDAESLDVPVPKEPGRYILSILKIGDDGDVGAASASFSVQ